MPVNVFNQAIGNQVVGGDVESQYVEKMGVVLPLSEEFVLTVIVRICLFDLM